MSTQRAEAHTNMRADDRGAIMVMGIFMCTCLVGALWYLAAVGDSILYRERLQEASDAVVFSDAVLHARGMNLIVLINLIMACVLGVRVALKIAQLVCLVAAAVFFVIGLLVEPFLAAADVCLAAAEELDSAIQSTREPINESLKGLSGMQKVIAAAAPPAAAVGAIESVGSKYTPIAAKTLVLDSEVLSGLPVERGSETKLCAEAGRAAGTLFGWLLEQMSLGAFGDPSDWLAEKMGALTQLAPGYFCEMGTVGESPDAAIDGMLGDSANERCKDGGPVATYDKNEREWESACAAAKVICIGDDGSDKPVEHRNIRETGEQRGQTTADQQRKLDELRHKRDAAATSVKEYLKKFGDESPDENECRKWAKDQVKDDYKKKSAQTRTDGEKGGGDTADMTGKKVKDGWVNGCPDGQFVGGAMGDTSFLERSVKFVRIAAVDGKHANDTGAPVEAKVPAWTQAELFFDCSGAWSKCNEEEDAMWHLQWRARLRRYDGSKPLDEIASILSFGTTMKAGYAGIESVLAKPGFSQPIDSLIGNSALRLELATVIADKHNMYHGIH